MKDKLNELMLKFLSRNYPITRIKVDGRFRRGVMIEGTGYPLSHVQSYLALEHKLLDILAEIFNCTEKSNRQLLRFFFDKKK